MCVNPDRIQYACRTYKNMEGFIILVAIGFLLILGILSSYLLYLSSRNNQFLTHSIQYNRIQQAARSGLVLMEERIFTQKECTNQALKIPLYEDIPVTVQCAKLKDTTFYVTVNVQYNLKFPPFLIRYEEGKTMDIKSTRKVDDFSATTSTTHL